MKLTLALALAALSAPALAQPLTRVRIDTPDARRIAARLEHSGFDVLEGSVGDSSLEVIVSDSSMLQLRSMGLRYAIIEKSRPFADIQRERQNGPGGDPVPPGYPDLAAILAQMNARAAAYPAICKVVDLTTTYGTPATANGRHLYAVKISDNVNVEEDEPSFLLAACHHAREIGTPVLALDNMDRLLTGYGVDPQITSIVNKYEIWVIPVCNPDGYDYVFTTNNLWRKNRRNNGGGAFGVDQNRNYPFGWTAACSGSTATNNETYKGPSAGSEPETQAIVALSADRNFDKVIDYHSYGRETLYSYLCLSHPLTAWLVQEAAAVSAASGYAGATRAPSAEGEEEEDQLARRGSLAFLTEIGTDFQPTYASAQAEAAQVWGGTLAMLNRPISITGHVTSAATGLPVLATITYTGVTFTNGETNASRGPMGRYHAFLPPGTYTVNYSAPGYVTAFRIVIIGSTSESLVDVALMPVCYANCDGSTTPPILNVNDFACFLNKFAAGDTFANCDGSTAPPVLNVLDFSCFLNAFAVGCT